MKITKKLCDSLLNDLACVCISANGGVINKKGMPTWSQEQRTMTEKYARNTFNRILDEWEELFNEKWEVCEK